MLGALTDKLRGAISKLTGKRTLTEDNISEALKDVRLALLEADVNYGVVKNLIKRIKEKALGEAVLKSVSPGQQFIKIVHDELVALMGSEEAPLKLEGKPAVIMMCGLQGSGKTTHTAKLARYLLKEKKVTNPLLVACDLQRPAAIEQLQLLAKELKVPVFSKPGTTDAVAVAKEGMKAALAGQHDLVIFDTAGRLHIDEPLMQELEAIKKAVNPSEVLFVANATTGQDAVQVAVEFDKRIGITGTILTMLDGNARGGAALSIREVTGKPLKFEGVGEKLDDIQLFNPHSMADRILGMGDTINLVRKAKEMMDHDENSELEKKVLSENLSFEDLLTQMRRLSKLGPLKGLLKMLPGVNDAILSQIDEKDFGRKEAIILSMTKEERRGEIEISMGRRRRIAQGSGVQLDEVSQMIKQFGQAKKVMKSLKKGFPKNLKNIDKNIDIEKMMGGASWR